ncbi:MAG: hypothetical protein ACOVNU_09090 [Candidatus Kapaibacteriota bacterium]
MGALNIHTQSLTDGTITITAADNVLRVSVLTKEGIVVVQGSRVFQNTPSTQLTLLVGQGITIATESSQRPIDGVTITAETIADVADIVISTQ